MLTQATRPQSGPAETLPQLLHLHPRLDEAPAASRWHLRDTLLFVVGTCGAFWGAVAMTFLKV
jgi:hypothetical protein